MATFMRVYQSCSGSGFSESRIRIFGEFFGSGAGLDIIFAQAGSGAGLSKTTPGKLFIFSRFDFFLQKLFDNLRLERSDGG